MGRLARSAVREDAPRIKAFNIHYGSKRAWRATNMSIKALGDDHLDRLSIAAPVLIVQGEQDVIRETNARWPRDFPQRPTYASRMRVTSRG
jgi:pimeloyl-ACP methyl ester carboxylesterase